MVRSRETGKRSRRPLAPLRGVLDRLAVHLSPNVRRDPLTGLGNRECLAAEAARSSSFGLIRIDLEGFGHLDQGRGAETGDLVLVTVARRLSALLDGHCVAARLGGDAFAVIVHGGDPTSLAALAARIVASIERPIHVGRGEVRIGAQLRLARAGVGEPIGDVIDRAERMTHRA